MTAWRRPDDFQPLYSLSVQAAAPCTVTVTPGNAICTAADPVARASRRDDGFAPARRQRRGQVFAG
ncbi:MAG: hypothetical protein H6643_04315 [Caldilineaceae bacterium]|nr:hypothetical protein [Caldilineaceae bacterium]